MVVFAGLALCRAAAVEAGEEARLAARSGDSGRDKLVVGAFAGRPKGTRVDGRVTPIVREAQSGAAAVPAKAPEDRIITEEDAMKLPPLGE